MTPAGHPEDPGPEASDGNTVAGELVSGTLDYDGGRDITVYLPYDRPQAIVFAGDGQLIAPWGSSLDRAVTPPTMIVGVHRSEDEMVRLHEYSPNFDAGRFAAHERFFVHTLGEWVASRFGVRLPATRTVVAGVSAGAELALAMGMRHPERYPKVFAASPGGGYQPPAVMPPMLPRAYLTAGTLEPFFRDNATRWAEALQRAAADIVMTECVGGHGDPFWQAEFVNMVRWAFGPGKS